MDRKRKSIFASHHDNNVASTKSKLNHEHKSDTPQQSSLPGINSHNDVQMIRMLLDELAAKTENFTAKLNPEILEAAKGLSLALQDKQQPKAQHTDTTNKSKRLCSSEHLPSLPPILDDQLEKAVFTHPGMSKHPKTTYDRLEILGDAYIELISTKLIWTRFQQIPSGRISQIRELLVKNETLAEYATQYGLDKRALVPPEHSAQAKRWTKTKGDIFEAYVAAVIQSQPAGFAVAETWLSELWSQKLEALEESSDWHTHSPAKELLARKIMGKGVKLKYIDERNPIQHEGGKSTFFIGVYLTGWGWSNKHLGSGQGLNKTIAGNKAAQQALENRDLIQDIVASKDMSRVCQP
ncbi:ribonuclease III [Aspergillus stella-maris]|uniref:ribonuclease III n=1 Tax=Aspergillus stella-maris TaxID=1810926 RepID=UPI003CCC9510